MASKDLLNSVNDIANHEMKLIGVFSKNREEWLILEYANLLYNNTIVPFYETLGL